MFLNATTITVEEHIIYLLLIGSFKFFLFLDEVGLVLLELKLQSNTFLLNFSLGKPKVVLSDFN